MSGEKSIIIRPWQEVVNIDFPPFGPITEEVVKRTKEGSYRFRGSVRIATGRIWTDKEYEERRAKALATPLP